MTFAEARAAWVGAHPFPQKVCEGSVCRDTTQDEYAAMADDRARMWLERVNAEALAAEEDARREKAKAAYTRLKAGTATNAQVQEVVAWLLRQEIKELLP
jgi:hypothetical protein